MTRSPAAKSRLPEDGVRERVVVSRAPRVGIIAVALAFASGCPNQCGNGAANSVRYDAAREQVYTVATEELWRGMQRAFANRDGASVLPAAAPEPGHVLEVRRPGAEHQRYRIELRRPRLGFGRGLRVWIASQDEDASQPGHWTEPYEDRELEFDVLREVLPARAAEVQNESAVARTHAVESCNRWNPVRVDAGR